MPTRRDFIKSSLALGLGLALSHRLTAAPQAGAPPDVGRKFHPDGSVRAYPGNTIICPLRPDNPAYPTVLKIHRLYAESALAGAIALLPPSSYHMTVFDSCVDQRRLPGFWPADLPLDFPLDRTTAVLREKLAVFRNPNLPPYRMRVAGTGSINIALEPETPAENLRLRALRLAIAECIAIRRPDHDQYRFHLTLAYQIKWFDAAQKTAFAELQHQALELLRAECPVWTLPAANFCRFNDMFAFEPLLPLAS